MVNVSLGYRPRWKRRVWKHNVRKVVKEVRSGAACVYGMFMDDDGGSGWEDAMLKSEIFNYL